MTEDILEREKFRIRFRIEQLRKDKIIYGVEAAAFSITCLLIIVAIGLLWPDQVSHGGARTVIVLIALSGFGYEVYVAIGNTVRFRRLLDLEKKLSTLMKE